MSRPQLCVGAVVVDDDRLLLVRRGRSPSAGEWSVPGGRVEPGETVAAAVLRELREEAGVDGVCGPLLGWVELIDDGHHFVVLDFSVELDGPGDPVAGDDATEAAWFRLDEVTGLPLVAGLAAFLQDHGVLADVSGDVPGDRGAGRRGPLSDPSTPERASR